MAYSIPSGAYTQISQNVAYALPPKLCFVQSTVAIDSSADGTTWAALTGANTTGVNCAAAWIRCTTASPFVMVKTYT